MKLLTAKKGEPHFTSMQFRAMLEGVIGSGSYITENYEKLTPELAANNIIKIRSGLLAHHGGLYLVEPGTYDEVSYINGSQGLKRIDLIVARYTKSAETGIEDGKWIVIQGESSESNPVAPEYIVGNMQEGALVDDCPVFEIHFDGINVTEVKTLLDVVPSMDELSKENVELNSKNGELSKEITKVKSDITALQSKNTTLSNEVNALKNKTPFSKMSMGKASLTYYDSNWLQGSVTLDKTYSGNAQKIITIDYVSGAALLSENYPTLSAVVNGNQLTIYASGSFVAGHRLEVGYVVIE